MPSPSYLKSPARFFTHYVGRRPWHYGSLLVLMVGAASCAVAVQYAMKLIVDGMAGAERDATAVWSPLALFIGLIAAESALWRLGGWVGCRTVVTTGVDIRLDLFQHLSGHPMRYFNDHFAGALGNRITATAGAMGQLISSLTWKQSTNTFLLL